MYTCIPIENILTRKEVMNLFHFKIINMLRVIISLITLKKGDTSKAMRESVRESTRVKERAKETERERESERESE